jgi:imidazolonepropionase-like amidohydrolase
MSVKTKIQHVRLYNGKEQSVERTSIVFDRTGILALGEEAVQTHTDIVIDGTELTCLPGLFDCHVHISMDGLADPFRQIAEDSEAAAAYRSLRNAREHLKGGVVTVRNVGAKFNVDVALRDAIQQGLIEGPHIYASGEPIVMTGGHGHPMAIEADGVDEVRKAARKQLKSGVDLLKLMATGGVMTKGVEPGSPQLSEEELRCACEEAAHAGKTTAAHAQGVEGIKNAIRAGITTVEHGIFLDDEAIEMMLERGTFLVPTLAAPYHIVKNGLSAGIPAYAVRKAQDVMESHIQSFRKAYQAGVKIAAGTDAGTPFNLHGDFATELVLMVEAGMTPMDALHSATYVSAEAIRIHDVTGSLEKGKWADIILVEGNPLESIEDIRNIRFVYKQGKCMVSKPSK